MAKTCRSPIAGAALLLAAAVSFPFQTPFASDPPRFAADTLSERVQLDPREGTLRYGESDFELNATGFALALRRAYSSANAEAGAFGRGWASVLDVRLEKAAPDRIVLHDESGGKTVFTARRAGVFLSQTGRPQWLTVEKDGALLRDVHGRFLAFDGKGRLTGIYNAAMAGLELEWEGERPAALRDAQGRSIGLRTDDEGRVVEARGPAGQLVRYEHAQGRLARVFDSDSVRAEYSYDPPGRLATIVVGGGERAEIRYDEQGRAVALGGTAFPRRTVRYREVTVPFRARVTEIADTLGRVVRYRFRESPAEAQLTLPGGAAANVDYDARRLPVRIDLPQERRVEFKYDDTGNLTRLILPGNVGYEFGWTGRGFLGRWTRDDGAAFAFDRADSGQLREVRGPRPQIVRRLGFDAQGRLAWLADGAGRALTFSRNIRGDLASVGIHSGAAVLRFEHDEAGRMERIAAAGRPALSVAYDSTGRPEAFTDPAGGRLALGRDRLGRPALIEDSEKHRDQLERDAAGRPAVWRRPDGGETRLLFDLEGNLAKVMLPEGNSFLVSHNDRNLATSDTAAGVERRVQYDEFGCIVGRSNLAGPSVSLLYSALGRPAQMVRESQQTTRFQFGPEGRLLGMESFGGSYRFGGDVLGRPVRVAESRSNQWAEYQFDDQGRPRTLATSAGTWVYEYDGQGRIVRLALTGERFCELRYVYENGAARLPARVFLPGGTNVACEYDAYGRAASIHFTLPGGKTGLAERYTYDARGNVVRIESTGRRAEFEYDAQNRLTAQRLNGQLYARLHYGRDGRVLRLEGEAGNLELAYGEVGAPVRSSLARFEYGLDGNRLAALAPERETQYRYDLAGRLLGVLLPTGVNVGRTYSPNGWPVSRTGRGRTVSLFYCGDRPLLGTVRSEGAPRRFVPDPLWGGVLGEVSPARNELAYRDGQGRLWGVGTGGDAVRPVAWGLLGRQSEPGKAAVFDALALESLDFDPETNLAGAYDTAQGCALTPRTLREGLAAYARDPRRPPAVPSWAVAAGGRSAGSGETALLEELAGACAAGQFAPGEDSLLRYLLAAGGSPGWPDLGAEETFDSIFDSKSFRTPAEIARQVGTTLLRDATGGLRPQAFAHHVGLPPSWCGLGRYRELCPTLSVLPPVILENEMVDDGVWREDPAFAAADNMRHGWTGRLLARAAERSALHVGEDGTLRLLGELLELARWTTWIGDRLENEGLPATPETPPSGAAAARLARRDRFLKALDVTP